MPNHTVQPFDPHRSALRSAYILFITTQGFQSFITLTIGGEIAASKGAELVRKWAQRVDQSILGTGYRRYPDFRVQFIGVPEMLAGHAHYHLAATAPQPGADLLTQSQFDFVAWEAWLSICGTGKFHSREIDNQMETALYMTKDLYRQEVQEGIILAKDFQPVLPTPSDSNFTHMQ